MDGDDRDQVLPVVGHAEVAGELAGGGVVVQQCEREALYPRRERHAAALPREKAPRVRVLGGRTLRAKPPQHAHHVADVVRPGRLADLLEGERRVQHQHLALGTGGDAAPAALLADRLHVPQVVVGEGLPLGRERGGAAAEYHGEVQHRGEPAAGPVDPAEFGQLALVQTDRAPGVAVDVPAELVEQVSH
ncbi:hypothetical protein ACFQ1L_23810 [Phytohabitans flavus]|uniref:hypothetical protein n=1 Tax=Phytohabitans flavus TaxID=1076124 RepID=UPI003637D5C3